MEQSPERSENLYFRINKNTYVPCGQNVNTEFLFSSRYVIIFILKVSHFANQKG